VSRIICPIFRTVWNFGLPRVYSIRAVICRHGSFEGKQFQLCLDTIPYLSEEQFQKAQHTPQGQQNNAIAPSKDVRRVEKYP
jgi:hypothetical protein